MRHRPDHPSGRPGASQAALLRDALVHLDDVARLAQSPLAGVRPDGEPGPAGLALQRRLVDAIRALRPARNTPADGRRAYMLMRLRYLERRAVQDVCGRLAISDTEYYRTHARALASMAGILAWGAGVVGDGASARAPFVGRRAEMRLIRSALEDARAGRGRLVLVAGSGGIGKTRLADEAAAAATALGLATLRARCLPGAASTYAPWVDALRPALCRSPEEAQALTGAYLGRLALLFPEIARPDGDATAAMAVLDPSERARQLQDGILHAVERLAARAGLLLVVDDVQWAADLDLLRRLAIRAHELPLVVLALYRDGNAPGTGAVADALGEIARAAEAAAIDLPPLTAEETSRLVEAHLGTEAAGALGARLFERTHGHPLFASEMLRALAESDRPAGAADLADLPLPRSLGRFVLDRASALGAPASELLSQAAVLGSTFRLRDLITLSGRPEHDVVAALDRAVRAGLVFDHGEPGAESYAFSNDPVREILYADMAAPARRLLHRKAARAIESDGEPDGVFEAARHWAAGQDSARGVDANLRAAREACRGYDWARAIACYRAALALLPTGTAKGAQRADILEAAGELMDQAASSVPEGVGHLEDALALRSRQGDIVGAVRLHMRLASVLVASIDPSVRDMGRARSHLEAARRGVDREPAAGPLSVQLHMQAATADIFALDVHGALAEVRSAREGPAPSDDGVGLLLGSLEASLRVVAGECEAGMQALDAVRLEARARGPEWYVESVEQSWMFVTVFVHPARVAAQAGSLPAFGSGPAAVLQPVNVLRALAHTGDFARGDALLARLSATCAERRIPPFGPEPQHLVRYLVRRGRLEEAEILAADGMAWARQCGDVSQVALLHLAEAERLLIVARPDGAERSADTAARLFSAGGARLALPEAHSLRARALVAQGRIADAQAAVAEAREVIGVGGGWGSAEASVRLAEGVVAAATGDGEGALRDLEATWTAFGDLGQGWDEAEALCEAGLALAPVLPARALACLDAARSLWASLGVPRHAERCVAGPERVV